MNDTYASDTTKATQCKATQCVAPGAAGSKATQCVAPGAAGSRVLETLPPPRSRHQSDQALDQIPISLQNPQTGKPLPLEAFARSFSTCTPSSSPKDPGPSPRPRREPWTLPGWRPWTRRPAACTFTIGRRASLAGRSTQSRAAALSPPPLRLPLHPPPRPPFRRPPPPPPPPPRPPPSSSAAARRPRLRQRQRVAGVARRHRPSP